MTVNGERNEKEREEGGRHFGAASKEGLISPSHLLTLTQMTSFPNLQVPTRVPDIDTTYDIGEMSTIDDDTEN